MNVFIEEFCDLVVPLTAGKNEFIKYNKEQFSQQICYPTEIFFCLQPDLHEIWHEDGP